MKKDFFDAVKARRTYYQISKESPVSDERIQEIVEQAVKHSPTAFNSQSGRVVLLLGEQHDKLWNLTKETLRKVVPAESFAPTEEKIDSFKNGYGTILFFDEHSIVENLQQKFPLYKDNFPVWSQQSSGMLQYIIWTALEIEGFGVSLQHYNPLIDAEVKKTWNIPTSWKLIGQMPFGKAAGEPKVKDYEPLEKMIKIYR